jgi:hypothetical protein
MAPNEYRIPISPSARIALRNFLEAYAYFDAFTAPPELYHLHLDEIQELQHKIESERLSFTARELGFLYEAAAFLTCQLYQLEGLTAPERVELRALELVLENIDRLN